MAQIDTAELFAVLGDYDDYPASGYRLAEYAKKKEASDDLVSFLNGIDGQVESQADVFAHAADPEKSPRDASIAGSGGTSLTDAKPAGDDALHISEVKGGQ